MSRRAGAAWALGILAAVVAYFLVPWDGIDVNVYQYGGYTVRIEPGAIYDPVTGRPHDPGLNFTYPPIAALLFVPISYLSHDGAYLVMILLSLVFAVAVAADIARRLRARLPQRWAPLAPWVVFPTVLGAWMLTDPFQATLSFGQVNLMLFGACYLAVAYLGLGFWAGVVIGFCGAIKLTPLALGVLPGARRRWDCVAGMAAGFGGATALAWLVLPRASNAFWFGALGDPERIGGIDYIDNVSYRSVLARYHVPEGAATSVLWLGLSFFTIGVVWWFASRQREATDLELLGLCALPMLAASPITWSHHWVWLPAIALSLLAVRHSLDPLAQRLIGWGFAVVVVYLVVGPKQWLKMMGIYPEGHIPPVPAHLTDIPALWLLLVTVLLLRAVLATRRRAQTPESAPESA